MRILVVAAGLAAQADLTALLEGVAGVELVGATVPASAAADAVRLEPDVVVVHLDPADDTGLTAIEALTADHDAVPVLAVLNGSSPEDAILAGAGGVLPSGGDGDMMAAALQVLGQGLAVLGREELRRLVAPEPA
ncbi:MAG: hypothetical protein WAT58_07570, partial [Candidatus Dormiibacterota bacterium]